jgi:hypothetical protein
VASRLWRGDAHFRFRLVCARLDRWRRRKARGGDGDLAWGDYALSASALGGLLTLSIIGLRKWPLPGVLLARQWMARLHEPGTGIPYGIALASAGLILYPETAIWLAAAAAIH